MKFSTKALLLRLSWNITVCIVTLVVELWVFLLLYMMGEMRNIQVILFLANFINLAAILPVLFMLLKIVYDKTFAAEDTTRFWVLGKDFYPPIPKWEWNSPPLLLNVCNYSDETGWDRLYPNKNDKKLLDIERGTEDRFYKAKYLKNEDTECPSNSSASIPKIEFLEPGSINESNLSLYEIEYFANAAVNNRPTVVVCVCYLLAKESNIFLLESLEFFAKVHKAPIYVMTNARDEGTWVNVQLNLIAKGLAQRRLHRQVKIMFVTISRSKAANLNAFIDALPVSGPQGYKYVMNYDVDDRPTYNEASMLDYAEGVVGKTRSGSKIVGIQGPCIECYNDTLSGLLEAGIEFNAQTYALSAESRFLGKVKSQGSNHLILTEVFRRYRFNTNVLLEDWRWTVDMIEAENFTLTYARTMVSYGQMPRGWNALARRRNRWNKGRVQEAIHDAFGRSGWKNTYVDRIAAISSFVFTFVVLPVLHMLLISGFVTIFREAGREGRIGLFEPDQLAKIGVSPILGSVWNVTWPAAMLSGGGFVFGLNFVCTLLNSKATSFYNGRDLPAFRFLHFFMHFTHLFMFLFSPFTRNYQYGYYCLIEFLLEKALLQQTLWVPTPKVAYEELTDEMDEEESTSQNSARTGAWQSHLMDESRRRATDSPTPKNEIIQLQIQEEMNNTKIWIKSLVTGAWKIDAGNNIVFASQTRQP